MRFPILLSIKLSPTRWMGARQNTEFSVTSLSKCQAYAALLRGKNTGLIFQTVRRAAQPDQNSKLMRLFPWGVCRVQPAGSERGSRLQHSGPVQPRHVPACRQRSPRFSFIHPHSHCTPHIALTPTTHQAWRQVQGGKQKKKKTKSDNREIRNSALGLTGIESLEAPHCV